MSGVDWNNLKAHPEAEFYPLLDSRSLINLAVDIQENGQQIPITLTSEEPPRVLDGRNRLEAFRILAARGIELEPKTETYTGPLPPKEFVRSRNFERRHLKEGWLIDNAEKLLSAEREAAQRRMLKGSKPVEGAGKATEKVAEQLGMSPRKLEMGLRVKNDDPELFSKIGTKEVPTINAAHTQLLKKKKQGQLKEKDKELKDGLRAFFTALKTAETTLNALKLEVRDIPTSALDDEERGRYQSAVLEFQKQLGLISRALQGQKG